MANLVSSLTPIVPCPPDQFEANLRHRNIPQSDLLKSKIKSWDKEEVQYQVTHYLDSTDDEPESWNVYSIMDACHIDHKWESLVMSTLLDLNSKFNSQRVI